MSDKARIQERLKELAAEMSAMLESDEGMTEEQEAAYSAAETEADSLTEELAKIEDDELKESRRSKAEEIRQFAKRSNRQTSANATGTRITRQRLAIEDDPKRGFRSLAHFAIRVFDAGNTPRNDEMLMQVAAGTGMQQSITADGGVLVPPSFSKTIWDAVLRQSNSLLDMCYRLPIDSGSESVTVPCVNESSRADGSRHGGIQGYWKSELSLMTESKVTLREVKLTPHELYVFAFISDKLLRNAPATASAILERSAADEIAFKVGDAIINGSGLGKPRGIVGHPGTVEVSKEVGQPAATLVKENIDKMYSRCHSNFRGNAVWLINQDVEPALEQLVVEVGTGGVPAYLPPGGVSEAPYARLKGKPVIPIEYCSTLGTVGDIIFCNLQAYVAAVKGMVDQQYSMHLKFDYGQTAFRIIFEMDGQPWLETPITPYKGTANTLSPIVTLETR